MTRTTPLFVGVALALSAPGVGAQDTPAKDSPLLSRATLNKGFSLISKVPGFRLVDVNIDFRPQFNLFGGPVNVGGIHLGSGSSSSDELARLEGARQELDAQLVQVEKERNELLKKQLEVSKAQLEVQITQARLARDTLDHDRGVFQYQKGKDRALLRRDEYASVLRPGKLVVVVADFSSGGTGEGQEIADEIAVALAELKKVGGIDFDVLVGEVRPGVVVRSEILARDVGEQFPKGTCYAVIWGTLSPRTVGKFRPHVTSVFKSSDDHGVSRTYTMDLDAQTLPQQGDDESRKRALHEQYIAFAAAVVPGCHAAHEVTQQRKPDLSRFIEHIGKDSEFARALIAELGPLAIWPDLRDRPPYTLLPREDSPADLRYLTRMSAVSSEGPYPQLVMNTRDNSPMSLITEPGTTKPRVFVDDRDRSHYIAYIDVHETTWRQYLVHLNRVGNGSEKDSDIRWLRIEDDFTNIREVSKGRYEVCSPADAQYPVMNVTYYGARRYCRFVGKELPRSNEWQAAARPTKDGDKYPWGGDGGDLQARCASGGVTRSIGTFAATDRSAIGCLDMAGNVSEWCEEQHPRLDNQRVVCGGNFADRDPKAFEYTSTRGVDQYTHSRHVGFRGVVRIKVG
jgi:hypothetical protein